jgi:methionyl-tRNA formyltransferase
MNYSIAIAGSTSHTVQCAEALLADPDCSISWILTPAPKPVGRKQIITPNPLHQFAEVHDLPFFLVDKKIDQEIQAELPLQKPDLLLVVDFGYLIPKWLLELPLQAPLNIHPSDLPRWRGSSPGQFVLLYGEENSTVTLMIMNEGLDTGPVLYKHPLQVSQQWTQTEYYFSAFDQICQVLPQKIKAFVNGGLLPQEQPQDSPTPIARRLSKEDGFVSWEMITTVMNGQEGTELQKKNISPLLLETHEKLHSWPQILEHATRALSPWPILWSIIPTDKGEKRMQILESKLDANQHFILETVKIEGQEKMAWNEAKTQLK